MAYKPYRVIPYWHNDCYPVMKRKNAPGVTRTHGTRIRNPLLYPPELRGHCLINEIGNTIRKFNIYTIRQSTGKINKITFKNHSFKYHIWDLI
jgi:hypothetical protein